MELLDEKRYKNSSETEGESELLVYTEALSLNKVILDIIARIGFLVFIYCWNGI